MEINKEEIKKILNEDIYKIIISNLKDKSYEYKKIIIEGKNKSFLISSYTNTQVFHKNINKDYLYEFIDKNLELFKQFTIFSYEYEYTIKLSKKNKILLGKTKNKNIKKITYNNNNRKKQYILEEGTIIEPLIDMGIFTKDGKIVTSMYDKYKQINRFVEIIDDSIKKSDLKTINIVDFGCGKSYLTFVIYYYFRFIKNINVNILGLDLKEKVITDCNATAKRYGYDGLKFELGNINGFETDKQIDMVITLHACDTATDYALYNAIKWKAKMIFSVPCCQHEVNTQIKSNTFPIITRYGIAKERISAIYTDIIRCNLLEAMSYKVQLMEFVDFENTPKNLLIRANLSQIPSDIKVKMISEVEELSQSFNINQKLYVLLKNNNMIKNMK